MDIFRFSARSPRTHFASKRQLYSITADYTRMKIANPLFCGKFGESVDILVRIVVDKKELRA